MQYAIYMTLAGRTEHVLLTDGAWTSQQNCCKPPMNHTPRLFPRLRTARDYVRREIGEIAVARKYTGPKC